MSRLVYTLLYTVLLPCFVLRLFQRSRRAPAYRQRIAERFGVFPAPDIERSIWVHAVSVGEVIAATPVINALLRRNPKRAVVVTTMTPTGSERVRELFGDRVLHVYAPYDTPGAVTRFLDRVRPELALIIETELWPNTLALCARRCPVLLVNARLSEKSAAGYRRIASLSRGMMSALSHVAAQGEEDGNRFLGLGLPASRLSITGSIKFDIHLSPALRAEAAALRRCYSADGARPVVIAASTHAGEDEVVLAAFQRLRQTLPAALLILVPRHPERFAAVVELCEEAGYRVSRRSRDEWRADTQVLVGDTMGELLLLYGCADVAFVGGSLVPRGGHNMVEPALWGMPIVTGASDFNFAAISASMQRAGALRTVESDADFARCVMQWLTDSPARDRAGKAALRTVAQNQGALHRVLAIVDQYLSG